MFMGMKLLEIFVNKKCKKARQSKVEIKKIIKKKVMNCMSKIKNMMIFLIVGLFLVELDLVRYKSQQDTEKQNLENMSGDNTKITNVSNKIRNTSSIVTKIILMQKRQK